MRALADDVDINKEEATWIAQGLRALAHVDGLDAAELALIEDFERQLQIPSTATDSFDAAGSPLRGDSQQAVFVRTLVLLSLVDGQSTKREEDFIADICSRLGVDDSTRETLTVDAKKYLLSSLAGVEHYRAQAEAVGQRLGLSSEQIAEVLAV